MYNKNVKTVKKKNASGINARRKERYRKDRLMFMLTAANTEILCVPSQTAIVYNII